MLTPCTPLPCADAVHSVAVCERRVHVAVSVPFNLTWSLSLFIFIFYFILFFVLYLVGCVCILHMYILLGPHNLWFMGIQCTFCHCYTAAMQQYVPPPNNELQYYKIGYFLYLYILLQYQIVTIIQYL